MLQHTCAAQDYDGFALYAPKSSRTQPSSNSRTCSSNSACPPWVPDDCEAVAALLQQAASGSEQAHSGLGLEGGAGDGGGVRAGVANSSPNAAGHMGGHCEPARPEREEAATVGGAVAAVVGRFCCWLLR